MKTFRCRTGSRRLLLFIAFALINIAASVAVSGRVVGVADGDTVTILKDGKTFKIRLHGVDCPEKRQAFGTRAKQFTSSICFDRNVTVLVHDRDHYGRLVGEVILENGTNVNHEIVKAGMGFWYRKYAPADSTLKRLEQYAREKKLGVWSQADPQAPWDFRRSPKKLSPKGNVKQNCRYWLNTGSDVRHNRSCKWFGNTSKGRCCKGDEGRACGMCGG